MSPIGLLLALLAAGLTAGAFYLASAGFRMRWPATEPVVCGRPTSRRRTGPRMTVRVHELAGPPHSVVARIASLGQAASLSSAPPDLIHP